MDALLKILRVALTVLTERLLTLIALWMTFGMACWAMYAPTYQRLGMAGFFALSVFLPALAKERNREVQAQNRVKQEAVDE